MIDDYEELYRQHDEYEHEKRQRDAILEQWAGEYAAWNDEAFADVPLPTPETMKGKR